MSPADEPHYTINLRDDQGRLWPAQVYLETRWGDEPSFHPNECVITLKWDGGDLRQADFDYFEAFLHLREQLAGRGLTPICYGVSRRIIMSRMIRDMQQGLIAYKIQPDNSISPDHVVNIFETGEDVEPVSIEEQRQFQQDWLQMNSKR